MSNFTWNIKQAKITGYQTKRTKAWGVMRWTDGTANFGQQFAVMSPQIMEVIEQNPYPEKTFKLSGSMTQKPGYGNWKDKTFYDYLIEEIEVVND